MNTTTTNLDQSLWIGLESYNESNSNIFFGRDEEIQQLANDIFHNVQTVVYGPSGTGKTSIIRAGIFKAARLNGYFPVYIRLVHGDSKTKNYYKQIIDAIESEAKCQEIDIDNTIQYIKTDGDKYVCSSIWEYLHCNEFWTKENYPIIPLIVIDQFEEIFTLCQDKLQQTHFFEQISDLCDNKLPIYVKEHINDRNNERVEYSESANYRFVISLREDFLARLEELAENIPALKRNRFSLQCTNEEQALEIITKPSPGLVSEDVAIQIIERVTSKEYRKDFTLHDKPDILVEPSILSLFCSELDKKRRERGLDIISEDLIGEFGDNIIKDFYFDSLKDLSVNKVEFLENHLLTVDGFRDAVALQNAKSFGFTDNEISNLTNRRLVRIEEWDGAKRIEFTHDVLCKVALSHKQDTEAQKFRQEEESKRRLLEEEQERERTKRNFEYNQKKRATEHNVLVHKGRRLIDNALDFGEMRTLSDTAKHNRVDKILDIAKLYSRVLEEYLEEEKDSDFANQQVFSDPLLKDSICVLTFYRDDESTPTIDGLYGVELKYNNTLISDIFFKGKKVLSDGSTSFEEPIFILGGYCGIHIDYDDNHREIQRIYLDDLGNPITTQEGYSIVQTQYDEFDNPVKIRYSIFKNGKIIPAKHNHGNYGYDSVYDKNGNEIERFFVDEFEQRTIILSGVYGKRMTYDKTTFHLSSISNIDSNGELMPDKDGYVTRKILYDEKGMPTIDLFFDENDKPWRSQDGTYGSIDIIDFSNRIISAKFLDENGLHIAKNDGVYKTILKYNDKRQITEIFEVDVNGYLIEEEDKDAIKLFDYDNQNRVQTFKILDKERNFLFGKKFDYNKEGTHVIREFALSKSGFGKIEDFDVEGIEYYLDGDKNLPILQIFINQYKQFKTCNDGYYAIRTWVDNQESVIKQLYYDFNGVPMPSNRGIYGVKVEYDNDNTIRRINLDVNENMTEDNNGVAFTEEKKISPNITMQISFNKNGEPYADDGWVYVFQEKKMLNNGYQEKLYVKNSQKEQIQILWPHRANPKWGLVPCMFEETNFDEKGRPVSQYFKDANGNLVGDSDGDSYTIWEYEDNNIEILSLYDVNDDLKLRLKTKKDKKDRIIELSYLDRNNKLTELERGYSCEIHEYDDEEKMETISFIGSNGKVCNNREGYAHRIFWYDQFGRIIGQKDVTADGIIHGRSINFREYIDSERRECAYYLHREDVQGNVLQNDDGSVFAYCEEDAKGRPIKRLYLNADKIPMPDIDGDYGLSYKYNDDENLTIITCLNENAQPHNNKSGYGRIHIYKDDKDNETKRMHFTIEGTPATFTELLGCFGLSYEYPNDYNRIVGFLNENGEITTNIHGYAYREECFNPDNGLKRFFYYDKNRNNTQSLEDDNMEFGYAIDLEENWRRIVSLGKDGSIANNACGYAVKHEFYEDGKLCFYKYHNANGKPIADSVGDYGTEILRTDNGSAIRMISLNEKYEPHLNDYGYCFCDIITCISGDQIRIYRDMNGNQVLPQLSFTKKVKKWFAKSKNKENVMPTFNCRQIGAITDCALGNIEGNGLGMRLGLRNTYVLLRYDSWVFGDDFDELSKLLANTAKKSKFLVLLPVTLNGSLLQEVGDIIELNFPAGQIGMRIKNWGINIDTLCIILEKKHAWEGEKEKAPTF